MVESSSADTGKEDRFYTALKNAQPLAFLASVSIGLAVLIHAIPEFGSIYNNAIVAGSMFLFSFIVSLFYQLMPAKDETRQYLRWSQYVFLAFGILYLLLIVLNFSQTIPQIMQLVIGWLFLAAGISYVIPLKKRWKRIPKFGIGTAIFVIIILFGFSALMFVTSFLPHPLPVK